MTLFQPKKVLLVDHVVRRAKAIRATLIKTWGMEPVVAKSLAETRQLGRASDRPFALLMVAFGANEYRTILGDMSEPNLSTAMTSRLLITEDSRIPYPNFIPGGVIVIPSDVTANDPALVSELTRKLGPGQSPLPSMGEDNWPDSLTNQIRWLDQDGVLANGKMIIQHLVSQLDPYIRSFQLMPLSQGFSGANVFKLTAIQRHGKEAATDLVLKLTPTAKHQAYKCQHEIAKHAEIKKSFNLGIINHVPNLISCPGNEPAECEKWLAVMYDCVTHEELRVTDLERVMLESEQCVAAAPNTGPASRLTKDVLQRLIEALERWYTHDKQRAVRNKALWTTDDAPEHAPPKFPSYCFGSWEKNDILGAIHQLSPYGKSLLAADWEPGCKQVLRFIGADRDSTLPTVLTKKQPVLLSRVHGDLNANNVLIELGSQLVLFIDFACYQDQGHLVQDLARLEMALKIELMGREDRGPLGQDLNSTEFGLWCEAEQWLQSWPDAAVTPAAFEKSESVKRTFTLCLLIRNAAERIQRELAADHKLDPRLSYEASLLYHTVRSLRFASRPHLKRIFSVYSTLLLAQRLDSQSTTRTHRDPD